MNLLSSERQIKHLYSRAGFGIRFPELEERRHWSVKKTLSELFKESEKAEPLDIAMSFTPKRDLKMLSPEQKKALVRQGRQDVRKLNTSWIEKMSSSQQQLREKMTLFWHGHFACRSQNPVFLQQLNNIQRENALGNFRTLLIEVSQSPAMLQFLNNQQNRKGHPNENFARELMELFTLGRGNYTEKDVKEGARAFTGWSYNKDGEFQFRKFIHDDGSKTFLGKTGNFEGQDIINIILQKPEAARFIARKIYLYLVNDIPNEKHIDELGEYFYQKDYDISLLVKKIFLSDWFYSPENVGTKIKSPAELLVGLNRQFGVTYQNPQVLLRFQSALGQVLFYPPNVAGWPGGRNWIDSSSLMLRLKIPSIILNDGIIEFEGKADPEDEAILALNQTVKRRATKRVVQASANWNNFLSGLPKGTNAETLAEFLLQPPLQKTTLNTVESGKSLKEAAIELVSTPEYQLS